MNGPDLRYLATRAETLEDRTFDRLDEVHHRIAATRTRRRAGTAVGVVSLIVALVIGVAVVDHSRAGRSPRPAPNPTQIATNGADAAPAPATGTCWAVASAAAVDPDYLYDDSVQVPCSQPHTTETMGTVQLSEASLEEAEQAIGTCNGLVGTYLDVYVGSWVLNETLLFLPSTEQVADGATWVRCDIAFPTNWDPVGLGNGVRTRTGSARNIADHPPADYWACLAKPPTEVQPLIPCNKPHAYETTGTLAALGALGAYPSAEELQAEARNDCIPAARASLTGLDASVRWTPEDQYRQGYVNGVCFVFHQDGTPLPPR